MEWIELHEKKLNEVIDMVINDEVEPTKMKCITIATQFMKRPDLLLMYLLGGHPSKSVDEVAEMAKSLNGTKLAEYINNSVDDENLYKLSATFSAIEFANEFMEVIKNAKNDS